MVEIAREYRRTHRPRRRGVVRIGAVKIKDIDMAKIRVSIYEMKY